MRLELHFADKCTSYARTGQAKQPGFICWTSFAPVFSLCTVESFSVALSPDLYLDNIF